MKKIIFIFFGVLIFSCLALLALNTNKAVDPGPIALDQASAIVRVQELPEVVAYEAMLQEAGKKASFEA